MTQFLMGHCLFDLMITQLGHCERVLRFMGREVQGRYKFRMQAVKWMVAKL